jgi:hypothetical protein
MEANDLEVNSLTVSERKREQGHGIKRNISEYVYGIVLQHLSNMVKVRLPEF